MADKTTIFQSGTFYWFKVLRKDQLQDNFDGDGKEWSYDFIPDDENFLAPFQLTGRMKEPQPGMPGKFIHLKQRFLNKEGEENKPVKVEDAEGNKWDPDVDVGNGSKGVVKLQVADYGKGVKNIGIYTQAIRINDLVPYEKKSGFDDYDANKNKNTTNKSKAKPSFELDEDVPF